MENLLNSNLVYITEKLSNLIPVLIRLIQNNIITHNEYDIIEKKPTVLTQNIELVKILKRKDDNVVPIFLQILQDTGNIHVADKIKAANLEVVIDDNYNGPGTSKQQTHSQSLESDQDKISKSEESKPNASSAPNFNVETVSPSGTGLSMENNFVTNHVADQINKPSVLDQKWWPEQKHLIKSFYDRRCDGELIIEKLYTMLQESKTTVITQETIVVSGLGGIGKTSIAKSFANHYESEYQHIIWIDCGEGSLAKSFQSLARDLKVEDRLELTLTELAQKSFAQFRDFKCLILYDNAECYVGNEGIRDVLPKCDVNNNNNLHSIITSRNQEWGTENGYGKINTFCISVFSEEESLQFMKKSLVDTSKINDSQIGKLCGLLGHLPLALQIAVATLNNEGLTITEYIEQIVNHSEEFFNETFDDYEHTINKTMKISLDQIKNDRNGKHAYSILMTFGYIQPDDVTLSFLQKVERISVKSKLYIWKAIALLEKFSLVSVTNKTKLNRWQMERVSIHRLLQQVIRHHGKETEKEKLRRILSSNGDINHKLIPYTFAEKHEDLKQEFTKIRAQLIDQVKLADLLKERRFVEAADLALIIHEKFTKRQKEYLISKYNHAVCLEKSGQINKSVDLLRSLADELKSAAENKWEWIGEMGYSWTIDENNEFGFHLKELSGTIPNRLIIQIYIALRQKSEDELLRCHKLWESHFINISKFQKCDHLLIMLRLGLIISGEKSAMLIREEFVDVIGNYKCKNNSVDFFTWLDFSSKVVKVAIKLISHSQDAKHISSDWNILTKLFFVSRKFMFRIEPEEFQSNSSRCKLICDDLHTLTCKVNTNEYLQSPQNIISDLLVIIETESGVASGWKKFIPQVNAEVEYGCKPSSHSILRNYRFYLCQLPRSHSGNGELTYKSTADDVFFTRFPHPELLTCLTLQRMTVHMPSLLSSIAHCSNLVNISIKKVRFWGFCKYKMSLPNLQRFELEEVDKYSKGTIDFNVIDFCTFFGGKDSCIWQSLKNLDFFHIGFKSERFIKFDKKSETLTLDRVSINRCHYQIIYFRKLVVNECTFLINSSDNWRDCSCGLGEDNLDKSLLEVADINSGTSMSAGVGQVDGDTDRYLFGTEEMIIKESSFLDIKCNEEISINRFLIMFSYLRYLKIEHCLCLSLNLFGLDYIEIIDIGWTKVHCSGPTLKRIGIMNNQLSLSKRCKKLSLNKATPVDDEGNEVKTIDFSSLNVDEMRWQEDRYWKGYYLMVNRIPSGLKKLFLKGVELKIAETNLISSNPNSKDNSSSSVSSLHTLIMECYWRFNKPLLDLDILPHSLKEMKLTRVALSGQFSPDNPFHLNKIILDKYELEDFVKDELTSLLRRVDNVVITVGKGVLDNVVASFPCNVRSVYGCIDYPLEYVSYAKLDDSGNWSFKKTITKNKITEEEFQSKAGILDLLWICY